MNLKQLNSIILHLVVFSQNVPTMDPGISLNLFCIDLDNLNNVADTKSKILELLPPALMFVSPSGIGIKLVYKINIDEAKHIEYFKAFGVLMSKMSLTIDDKCKDVSRACFYVMIMKHI